MATSVSARERERLAKKGGAVKTNPRKKHRFRKPIDQIEGMRFQLFARAFRWSALVMALQVAGQAEESKVARAKALEELKAIEQKNEKLTQGLLEKSARDFTEAGTDKIKAVQMYLESYRNAEFGR
ncbi:MAG: hypothetical protein EBT57_10610, partial [Verrucomicrobia bacterium]|nr:hypothetical protein [Verrucomicrobiota bacterium]